jgi:hypothetical protein
MPYLLRSEDSFRSVHVTRPWGRGAGEGLLGGAVGGMGAVVRGVQPPRECEEDGPGGGGDVVGEEEVGEVERAFAVFLWEREA